MPKQVLLQKQKKNITFKSRHLRGTRHTISESNFGDLRKIHGRSSTAIVKGMSTFNENVCTVSTDDSCSDCCKNTGDQTGVAECHRHCLFRIKFFINIFFGSQDGNFFKLTKIPVPSDALSKCVKVSMSEVG